MVLTIELPSETYGTVQINHYITEDSTERISTDSFSGKQIVIKINLADSILNANPVLKYIVLGHEKNYESFFAGEIGLVKAFAGNFRTEYEAKSIFYEMTRLSQKMAEDSTYRLLCIQELSHLYKDFSHSTYPQFALYNAVRNNLISTDELDQYFDLTKRHSYWIDKLNRYLLEKDKVLTAYTDSLKIYTANHKFVLVKFWASWCKPCLADDKQLSVLKKDGLFTPFILGIQNDNKVMAEPVAYTNIIDPDRSIASFYHINSYPSYILFHQDEIVLRTHKLDEVITYVK